MIPPEAKFIIKDTKGNVVKELTYADMKDGSIVIELPYGDYTVEEDAETAKVDGYRLDVMYWKLEHASGGGGAQRSRDLCADLKATNGEVGDVEKPIKFTINEESTEKTPVEIGVDNSYSPIHTGSFDPNGGTPEPNDQTVNHGDKATEPETDPKKEGYTFDGWYTKDGEKYDFDTPVTEDIELIAHWTPIGSNPPEPPEPPELNKDDHFAYIIGYPDGEVKPNGTITRAEAATIFFRMLTDESRDRFWSQSNSFNDVALEDWFNNAISTLENGGILNGYPDGGFHPNGNITRAEFATMSIRFFQDTKIGPSSFSDTIGHWAEEAINMAFSQGLITGYPDGTFRPDEPITRAEAMTIINRVLERHPDKDHLLNNMITWPDNMDKSVWYYAEVQEATNSHEYEMVSGRTPYEIWQSLLPVRDWAAFEKVWSNSHAATNPGEVVGR